METPGWYLDERAYAGNEHLDPTYVPGYDRKASTDPTEDVTALVAAGLHATHTLIDLGAGTGTFALAVAPLCRRVIAVDVSPVMLALLQQKVAAQQIANVEGVPGGFLTYQHQGELADFVYSRHALHHLPDFWKALALQRIAAMLKPGGVCYLRDLVFACEPGEIAQVIADWLAGAAAQAADGWTRAELETHIRTEYSTYTWLLEPMIAHAGFQIHHTQRDSPIYATYTCIKKA
ncbi:MAG: methyltransferase domain-containing protein [Ktedonobacterales bacterium]|nr:methyltransferase domain-containing protein [Ktedonobacterales bacterium]